MTRSNDEGDGGRMRLIMGGGGGGGRRGGEVRTVERFQVSSWDTESKHGRRRYTCEAKSRIADAAVFQVSCGAPARSTGVYPSF